MARASTTPRRSLRPGRIGRIACLAAAVCATLAAAVGVPARSVGAAPSTAPVFSADFPDPDVITVGSVYWAYSTDSQGRNIQVITSTDLQQWSAPADALPTLPAWAVAARTWAPGVVQLASGFVMYYTVHDAASDRQCLSVATSPTPAGPFRDQSTAPFLCQLANGGSIDPSPFVGPDGRLYLVWKSEDNVVGGPPGLWAQQLSADGLSLVGSPSLLMRQTAQWQAPTVEGPAMIALGGRYYLFYGANLWNTAGAGIGDAVCASPLGPCTDQATGGPWMGSHGAVVGPSGPAPFRDAGGATRLAYHAWTGPVGYVNGGVRSLWIDALSFTAGYRVTSRDGGVFAFGVGSYLGSASTAHPPAPIVGIAQTSDGNGYWQVAADGRVFAYGGAHDFGSTGAQRLVAPIVGVIPSASDAGYALIARDGGLFTFGDFPFRGSDGGARSIVPVVGGATSGLLSGPGYWLARADGAVDAFGAAPALGALTGVRLRAPIVAIVPAPAGIGYWLVAADGGVFSFGGARYFGSVAGGKRTAPIVGMIPTPTGSGYWLVAADGGVFSFGDAAFAGSLGAVKLVAGVVGATGAPATPACPC
jgi:hypothetical protein